MGWDEDPPPEEEFIHMLKNAGYVFDGDGDSFHFETKTGRFLCPFSQSRLEIYAHLFAKQGMRAVTDAIEKEAADWKRHANPYTWGDEPTSLPSSQAVRINVYGSVHAGIPMEAQTDVVDWEEIPREWTAGGKEYFAVQVEGDCMAPKYLPKDVIIVRQTPDCESGQDVIVYVNGYDAELKRIHKEPDGITLQPLNSEYLPKRYRHNDPDHPVTVCGVVVEIRRKV
ncbi:MAG: S24 family peptidase [Clostridiales Family XIII bacterium]|jgi:SOS-response transcriptional repressor LexA|nr:S24 family peptidase [Clostridiales Family XIII bacterium]